jgi:hypothetical protein
MKEAETREGGDNPHLLQNSYLTSAASFYLQYRRWSKCLLGISADVSATYGGRMLGLYDPAKKWREKKSRSIPNQFNRALEIEQGIPSSDTLKSN